MEPTRLSPSPVVLGAFLALAGCGVDVQPASLQQLDAALSGISVPGRIQAEDFKTGGEGVGYHDTTAANLGQRYRSGGVDIQETTDIGGGFNVGWVEAGEWLAFDLSATRSGTYVFAARVASGVSGTKSLHLVIDGHALPAASFTDSAGWQRFRDLPLGEATLAGGRHSLRLVFDTARVNLNHVDASSTCVPTSCAAQGSTCGLIADGCGGTVACGSCAADASCVDAGGVNSCACNVGYSGDGSSCADVDECLSGNGGCSADATCANLPGSFTCECKDGYAGDGYSCADVDECLSGNGGCSANATCANLPGTRSCVCNPGYAGDGFTCVATAASCADGLRNGSETDVDCGGGTCPDCATGRACLASTDCASGQCSASLCVASSTALRFRPSGLDGAGFQNVVAFSPFRDADGKRPVLLGADVAGVHRSLDGGKNWTPANRGLGNIKVAALLWSDVTPGKVYAATDGGIYVSTDFAQSWSRRPAAVDFDANGSWQINGQEHPRPTGHLLAQYNSGTSRLLWVATATQGLKRTSNDGTSWDAVVLAGKHLRSVALDPANPDVLYVAVAYDGIYKTTNARGAMNLTLLPGTPSMPEEMVFVGNKLYVAAFTAGLFVYDGAFHALNSGIPLASNSIWESIHGYQDPAGNVVLFAGCAMPRNDLAVVRSTNGGASWASISSGASVNVQATTYGSSVRWWQAGSSYLRFAGTNFVTADLATDPDDRNSLLVAGRGGAWHGALSPSGAVWNPASHGLMVTVNMVAVADPLIAGRVYIGNMDYTLVDSPDHAASFAGACPSGAPSTGDIVVVDDQVPAGRPATVYLGASKRGSNTGVGDIWSNQDPIGSPGAWVLENLPVSNDVLALGVGHKADGTRVLLASVTGSGLWRKEATTWAQVTTPAPFTQGDYGTITFEPKSPVVYAIDGVGVWRSSQAGAQGSWVKLMDADTGYGNVNALAIDPTSAHRIYVSSAGRGGVWRIDAADTATPAPVRILAISDPGPIATDAAGGLYVHERSPSRLRYAAHPGAIAAPTFVTVSDTFYEDNNGNIRSLAVGPDGYVYTASHGVSVGVPASAP